jgi:hypothetical protein
MFLASRAGCAGIVFLLLATGISGPRPTPIVSGPNLRNEVPAVGLLSLIRRPICELSLLGLELAQPLETLTAYNLRTLYSC